MNDCPYTVIVSNGYRLLENAPFKDERKAKAFYSDCLLKYPTANVEFLNHNQK